MRWMVVVIFAFVMLVLEQGLNTLIEVATVAPSFLLIFAIFLALTAHLRAVPWLMIMLGAMADLSTLYSTRAVDQDFALIGPSILGFLFGGYFAVQLRALIIRDSPLALGFAVFICGIFVHLAIVALLSLRGMGILTGEPMLQWSLADQLTRRFFGIIYSAALAVPISILLIRLEPLMGITPETAGRPYRMRQVI